MHRRLLDLARGLADTARDAAAKEAAAYALNRVAGRDLRADTGEIIVEAGHVIDERAVAVAQAHGKIAALAAVAVAAQVQDAKEMAQTCLSQTPDGIEAQSLETVEGYSEARRHVGKYTGVDVTDIRGNVVIPIGTKLTDGHLRTARDAGLIDALLYAVSVPWTPIPAPEPDQSHEGAPRGTEEPCQVPVAPRRLPLVPPPTRPDD